MRRRSFLLAPPLAGAAATSTAWVAARPRLYYSIADLARLSAAQRAPVIESARRFLNEAVIPEDVAERGGGQHANYGAPARQLEEMAVSLGLAWHLTAEKQFAAKLAAALLAYSQYQRWYGQGLDSRVPPWRSELNTARFCFGFALGYDALHSYLNSGQRKPLAAGLARLGIENTLADWILPEARIHALDSMGHNWWSVCVAMAGVAALALLGEDSRAPEWLARIQSGFEAWFGYQGNVLQNKPANFDPHGAFYESISYSNYALSSYLRYRLAYQRVFPTQKLPRLAPLERTLDYFLQTLYPTAGGFFTPPIGDGHSHDSGAETIRLLVECGFPHPAAGYYLSKTSSNRRPQPLDLLLRKTPAPAPLPASTPLSSYYPTIGWATLRDSWRDNATFLAIKSGTAWNHAHADAGSFVLFHAGQPLFIDSSSCGYDNPAYTSYYTESRAHNVILFNGQGQPAEDHVRGSKFPGALPSFLDGLGVKYVYADSTGPTARFFTRNYRHWLWIGGVILVIDDLLAYERGRLDWLLHYAGQAQASPTGAVITNQGAQAELRFLYPPKLDFREEQGLAESKPNEKIPYLAFSLESQRRDQKIVAALIPQPSDTTVELLSAPADHIAIRIRHGQELTDVYLNCNADGRRMHVNTNNILNGWDTDAYLLALTRPATAAGATPATVTRYFAACASYLRQGERVVFSSLAKVDLAFTPGPAPHAAVFTRQPVELELMAAAAAPCTLNGKETPARFDPRRRLLSLSVKAAG